MAKRGKLEIMRDILTMVQSNRNYMRPTPLLRKSKMTTARFKEYYSELTLRGLLKEVTDEHQDRFLMVTDKGFRFLERYRTIVDFIDEFEL